MRKINIMLIILLSYSILNSCAHNNDRYEPYNFTKSLHVLVEQSVQSIKQHACALTLIPIIIYYHKNISGVIFDHPYISSVAFYCFIHFICDFMIQYQEQQSLLKLIALLKKIALYLVVCHGIKNYIHYKKLSTELELTDQIFFNKITENLPYSFHEITIIILKCYQELKIYLQFLDMKLPIESQEIVLLSDPSSINLHNIAYLVEQNYSLHQAIDDFQQNPKTHLAPLLQELQYYIIENFIDLEYDLFISNVLNPIVL